MSTTDHKFTEHGSLFTCVPTLVDLRGQNILAEMKNFWENITTEFESISSTDLTTNSFPLPRIKKIMKLEDLVKRVRDEAGIILGKAAEIFTKELTLRCWIAAKHSGRRVLQMNDMAQVVDNYQQFTFLVDIVPPSTKKACL